MKKATALATAVTAAALALSLATPLPAAAGEKKGVTLAEIYEDGRLAYTRGDIEKAKKLFSHILKYKPGHLPSQSYLAQIKLIEDQRPGNPDLEKKIGSIVLGEVDINDVPIADAVAYLKVRSRADSPDGYTPNILLKDLAAEQKTAPIKLHLTKVPLSYALKAVGDAVKVEFRYEKHAIVGSPRRSETAAGTASTE